VSAAAAIVLAAGEGRRMGGPKALLVVGGKPLLRQHVERLLEAGCEPIVVVVPARILEEVRQLLGDARGVRLVAAETSSMAESLTIGLQHLLATPDQPIVIATVDSLPVRRSTLDALIASALESGVQVATPVYQARGGHPVVARESLLRVFRDGYPGTLRELVRSAAVRRRLYVDDPAVGHDFDTPADLAALDTGE